jgi:hypothetical protein
MVNFSTPAQYKEPDLKREYRWFINKYRFKTGLLARPLYNVKARQHPAKHLVVCGAPHIGISARVPTSAHYGKNTPSQVYLFSGLDTSTARSLTAV